VSSKPSKVRLRFYTASLHRRSHNLSASLSEELRSKHGRRSIRVVKGDSVKVMRGEYRGVEGKVIGVESSSGRVNIEGVTREKIAGGTVPVRIHASKVRVTSLNVEDKWRKRRLEGQPKEE